VRVGAFNPYLHTRGGGERYFLEAASVLAQRHEVEVLVPPGPSAASALGEELAALFGLNVGQLRFVAAPTKIDGREYSCLAAYDASLTVTNLYPPASVPRPHVSILQFPWDVTHWSPIRRWRASRAFRRCDRVVTYSSYVRDWVRRIPGGHSEVVSPGVLPIPAGSEPRDPLILAVGRFTAGGHNKKHAAMIEAFRSVSTLLPGWRLIFAGIAGPKDSGYIDALRGASRGLAVEFKVNVPRLELESLYRRASFLWHATGFGEDPDEHPELMEHFGIVVVEAMSAGCVPIVFRGGGLPEIVDDGNDGVTWTDTEDLVSATARLAHDPAQYREVTLRAKLKAQAFGRKRFEEGFIAALPVGLWHP
jgi:glycosyltransferase involved in cell wall biosynthesis